MNKKIILGLVVLALFGSIFLFLPFLENQFENYPPTPSDNYPSPTSPNGYQFSNDWLNKRSIHVYGNPPLDYLRAVNATGVTWSVYYGGLNKTDQEYVDTLHRSGLKVASIFSTAKSDITDNEVLVESAHDIDLNGNKSNFSEDQFYMCYNNPKWQDFLKGRIREHIDGGADVIHIDEIGTIGIDSNGGFCEYCLEVFNNYLSSRYSDTQLRELFGIENIKSFNYRTYLLVHGAHSVWDDPSPYLVNEYRKSQFLSKVAFIRELIQYARDYAGRDVLFSGDTYGVEPNQQIYVQYLDLAVFEMPIGELPEGKLFTKYLLGEALDPSKPLVGFPDVRDLTGLSENDWWLWRHWLVEAYASGASFLLPYKSYANGGQYTITAERLSPYTSFISDHANYYENTTGLARVAILFDLNSTLFNKFSEYAQFSWESFESTGRAMQEAHIPFDVVYVGDGELVNKPITLSSLEKYSVVIIPSYYRLGQDTMDILNQYSSGGGLVLWSNADMDISDLIYAVRNVDKDFELKTNASSDLSIVPYKMGSSLLIHLINYSYDYERHDFQSETSIEITLKLPSGIELTGKILRLISPEADSERLEYTVQGDYVNFKIPSVHGYSVAIFE